MDVGDRIGSPSSFYFICGRTHPRLDALYDPELPTIRHLIRHIHERGHYVGLHPSYNTYNNPDLICSEASRLQRILQQEKVNQMQLGCRMHYLRWKWPITANGLEKAGFYYDSTLGYADRPGFRCGTCHPYQMFDPVAQRSLRLIQYPLIAMECSVIAPRYLNLGYGFNALTMFHNLKQRCRYVSGNFTLLLHNTYAITDDQKNFFSDIIYC